MRWSSQTLGLCLALAWVLLVFAGLTVGPALALETSQTSVADNSFTTRNLIAPSNLSADAVGHDAQLSWSAGQYGNGYSILGAANGLSSDCSGATFNWLDSTPATTYTDSDRYSPQGNYYCYQVQTTYNSWSSTSNNPIVASPIGFVATSVQLINDGNDTGCSAGTYGQSGYLDCGDQVILNFNQPVDTATGPTSSDSVCPRPSEISLGTTGSGICTGSRVGSFTKSTTTGNQTVPHGLGTTPKALILWSNGKTNESLSANLLYGFGISDGSTSKALALAVQDNRGTSNSSTRLANKAITFVQWGQALVAEADLSSWDSTNFVLNWTTNNSTGYVIHFIAIGGSDVAAKVVGYTLANGTGNRSVTGFGFQPDLVLNVYPDATFTGAPPSNTADGSIGLGAMDANGNQWASFVFTRDGAGITDSQRGQQTNAAIYAFNRYLTITKRASFVSMDADGFTLNYSTANSNNTQAFSLALKGMNFKVGSFDKSTATAPASQAVSGTGFQPTLLMLASFQDVAQTNPVVHTRFGFGASDWTTQGSSAFTDTDGLATSSVQGIDKTSKIFVKVNNSTSTINAEANLTSFDGNGFTLDWTTNDSVATQMLYLALGPSQVPKLGSLKGGVVGSCNCRFNATYTWSNGNTTLTVTIGSLAFGSVYPSVSSTTWTFYPTTLTNKLLSATGAFHICDTNAGGGNCLPATSSGASFGPSYAQEMQEAPQPEPEATVTPARKRAKLPSPTPTPTRRRATRTPRATATFTATASPTPSPTDTVLTPTPRDCKAKPAKPVLTAPEKDGVVSARQVLLDWSDSICAAKYRLLIKRDSKKGKSVERKANLTTSTFSFRAPPGKTIYFWRVLACNAAGCAPSKWSNFRVK